MVRTDSREQKLDAFLKPTNQKKTNNETANQKPVNTTRPNETPASSAIEQGAKFLESPMEIEDENSSQTAKKQR